MKKVIDTKKLLFENMAKLNPDFKMREEVEPDVEKGEELEEKTDKWIQKAVNPEHKGYCTPMTKPTCTPKRKALAKRFKKGIEDEAYGTPDPLGSHCAKPINEEIEKFSTVEKTKLGKTHLVAYPNPQGVETREGLDNWESKDRANRELHFVKSKEDATNTLKSF